MCKAGGDSVRKKISRLLVTMFIGFTLTLIISCILLIINSVGVSDGTKLEAVSIDPDSDVSSVYKKIDEVSVEVSEVSQVNVNVDSEYNFGFRADRKGLPGYEQLVEAIKENFGEIFSYDMC